MVVSKYLARFSAMFAFASILTLTAFSQGFFSEGFKAGTPVSSLLIGQSYWFDLPNSVWPVVGAAGVKLVRIGGSADNSSPLACTTAQGQLIQQIQEIRRIGAEPIIQVSNVIDNAVPASLAAAAAAMVKCVNITNVNNRNLAYPVKYWSIGNEPDGAHRSDTDAQIAALIEGYITAVAPAMRDVDPNITILAPELSFYQAGIYGPLLGGASDITGTDSQGRYYVDEITVHSYPFGGAAYTISDVINAETNYFPQTFQQLTSEINTANALNNRTGSHALTWGLTEFNITFNNFATNNATGDGVCSFLNGQFFASLYGSGMGTTTAAGQSIHNMNSWSVNEGGGECAAGDLGFLSGATPSASVTPRSSYYHMQLVSKYLLSGRDPSYLAPISSQAAIGMLAVATTSDHGAQLAVMVLNEDQSNGHSFSLRMDSDPVRGPGDTQINIPAGVAREYFDTIPAESTIVLIFNAQGQLTTKVTYTLADLEANTPPQDQRQRREPEPWRTW